MLDLDVDSEVLRVDGAGFDTLLAAYRTPEGASPDAVAVVAAVTGTRLDQALATVSSPELTLTLTVAGPDHRLVHRAWVGPTGCAMLLGVHDDLFQLVAHHAAFVPAALARLARVKPRPVTTSDPAPGPVANATMQAVLGRDIDHRRLALREVGAGYAWQLFSAITSHADDAGGGGAVLTVIDGPGGVRVHDPDTATLVPTTNTAVYRVLSTLAPARSTPPRHA